jgi:subtilisin family serine protease
MNDALRMVGLDRLLPQDGSGTMRIGLIDGPVESGHPALAGARIETREGGGVSHCAVADAYACQHGTFIAGVLVGQPRGGVHGLRPNATLVSRPVFSDHVARGGVPEARADAVADAIVDAVDAGARVINLSVGVVVPASAQRSALADACDHAFRRGVLVIAAAGNQGRIGPLPLVEHPWVIPVAAALPGSGRLDPASNIGPSIARRGVRAPSQTKSAVPPDKIVTMRGTSVAAAFVTATAALLLELAPHRSAADVRNAILVNAARNRTITPPLLDVPASLAMLQRR